MIKTWCGGARAFDTPANVAKFAVISIGPAALISATMGVTALRVGGYVEGSELGTVWMTWWVGDCSSALLLAPVVGYGFAWIGHFVFEKNKPATFQRPLYSFLGDWAMYRDILAGRLKV